MNLRQRGWFFTWNNPDSLFPWIEDEWDDFAVLWKCEKGKSGTLHLQGLMYFPNKKTFSVLKKTYPACHFEPLKDMNKAISYIYKKDTQISPIFAKLCDNCPKSLEEACVRCNTVKQYSENNFNGYDIFFYDSIYLNYVS